MKKAFSLFLCISCFSISIHAQWIWDRNKLEEIKKEIHSFTYANAYRQLIDDAEKAMEAPFYSVTFKQKAAPGKDPHDYVSLSRYFWPDPRKENGLPYIYRDGESNPELENYDRIPLGEMAGNVTTLSLAWYYSGEERYARKAVKLLRVWFLDKKTRMNPNLNYAQFVPGTQGDSGRPSGLIDSYSFVTMLNAVKLLEGSRSYTAQDRSGLEKWFSCFAAWWQNSDLGKVERTQGNNHGTTYDMQLTVFLLFCGDTVTARQLINEFPARRLYKQIRPDGSQPRELHRTLAFHYSVYNLQFFVDMCAIARNQGIELYKATSPDGRNVCKAVDFLTPYLGKDVSAWPYKQISGWEDSLQALCKQLYRMADIAPSREDYLKLYKQYSKQGLNDRNRLLYGAPDPIRDAFSYVDKQLKYASLCTDSIISTSPKKGAVIPRCLNKDGSLRLVNPADWCSGFFPGSLWMAYHYTKDDALKELAIRYTEPVKKAKDHVFSHDTGFKVFCSSGNAYKETRSDEYREVVLKAAHSLASRYNPHLKVIRSWDFNRHKWQYPVIIDNMMNLELLFEASLLTGDKTFYDIANAHATTTLENHFRTDYSSWHVVDYDTISGKARLKQTHQGYDDSSAWARGQSWALYGFAMSYRYTKNKKYLRQAQHIAEFIFTHPNLPSDFIPYWDFNDPKIPDSPRDASAACICASALYEMATYDSNRKEQYVTWADRILASLLQNYLVEEGKDKGFLLLHSVGNMPSKDEIDVPISYADYYFLEALLRRSSLSK